MTDIHTTEAREYARYIPGDIANLPIASLENVVVIGSFRTERMRREGRKWMDRWTVPMGPNDGGRAA